MSDPPQVLGQFRHPEWKRLVDECGPLLEPGTFVSYEDLSAFAGVDITSSKGRSQLVRFRREILKTKRLWLQNDRTKGYHCLQANEHTRAASDQFGRARRRMKQGREILSHTRYENLTEEQRRANTDMLARLANIEQIAMKTHTEVRKLVQQSEQKRLPSPMLDRSRDEKA